MSLENGGNGRLAMISGKMRAGDGILELVLTELRTTARAKEMGRGSTYPGVEEVKEMRDCGME